MLKNEKSALRRQFRLARKGLSSSERTRATRKANRNLYRYIKRHARIGIYWSVGSELSLHDFARKARQRGAQVYLPYIEADALRLWFTPYPETDAKAECKRRCRRPDIPQFIGRKIRIHRLNLLLLPLVGVDRCGYRLGQGGGYYDASLAAARHRLQPKKIGVGFACQYYEGRFPHEPHDMPLDAFVSETGPKRFTAFSTNPNGR
ncbi:5-formyltetrahydrofolate cyclo-ligase [Neisseria sp. S1]|uniref:5-formyltetrahydrofolate cyclo-ligase n=1 Tax=Neisseria sp. S1 TaxID=3318354 RepID=UPI003A854B9E